MWGLAGSLSLTSPLPGARLVGKGLCPNDRSFGPRLLDIEGTLTCRHPSPVVKSWHLFCE